MEVTLALVSFGFIPLAFLLVAAGALADRWRRWPSLPPAEQYPDRAGRPQSRTAGHPDTPPDPAVGQRSGG